MRCFITKSGQRIASGIVCIFALMPFSSIASDHIGHVIFATGQIRAVNDGETRILRRGSMVQEGDVIKSGRFSRSQIRMEDGALIAIRPGTEFGFSQYRYTEGDDSNNSSLLSLIKGGFRTISGLIGKVNKQNYKVRTSVATIGIRGTHYGLTICQQGDCNTESKKIKDGLYGSVVDGEISASNESGEFTFSNDEFFHVGSISEQPRGLISPPGVIFAQSETDKKLKKMSAVKKANATHTASKQLKQASIIGALAEASQTKSQLAQHIRENFQGTSDIDLGLGGSASQSASSGTVMSLSYFGLDADSVPPSSLPGVKTIVSDGTASNQIQLNSAALGSGMLVPVAAVQTAGATHAFALSNASVLEPQSTLIQNTTTRVGWGRWTSQYASVTGGATDPHVGQLHYFVATDATSLAQLGGLTGSANYSTLGGTRATDLAGNVAAGPANVSMTVTFGTSGTIDTFNVSTAVNGVNYQAGVASPVLVNTAVSNGLSLTGAGGVCPNCSGQASLTFFGSQADGAGTAYTIHDAGTNTEINGAAVLDNTSRI